MTKKIYKYELALDDEQTISMPEGAQILSVCNQNERICLWAVVDTNAPAVMRKFFILGTGWGLPAAENLVHLGTVLLDNGLFVWHVFEAQ